MWPAGIDSNRRGKLSELTLKGFLALRWVVGVGAVVLWNALMGLAIWLNGGWGVYQDPRAIAVLVVATFLLACLCLAVAVSSRVRDALTEESRRHYYTSGTYWSVGIISGLLCLALFLELLKRLSHS